MSACSSAASSRKKTFPSCSNWACDRSPAPAPPIPEIVELMHKPEEHPSVEDLIRRFREKDRRALARLLTLASRGEALEASAGRRLAERPKTCRVAAFTGSGGVGKSSLIGRLGRAVAGQGPLGRRLLLRPAKPADGRGPAGRSSADRQGGRRSRPVYPQPGRRRAGSRRSPRIST